MKIKRDFITNSSSTSFVGWGINIDLSQIDEESLIKKCFEKYNSKEKPYYEWEEFKELPIDEVLDSTPFKLLDYSRGGYGEDNFLAASPYKMKNDQTLMEFKDSIISELKEIGIEVSNLEYIEESWYSG